MQKVLGIAALLGTLAVVALRAWPEIPWEPRQLSLLIVLGGLCLGTCFLWLGLRGARASFQRALLIPLGLRVPLVAAITWAFLELIPRKMSEAFFGFEVGFFVFELSVYLLVMLLVHVTYAAWVTPMIVRAAAGGSVDAIAGLRRLRLGRTFVLLFLGTCVTLALVLGLLALVPLTGFTPVLVVIVGLLLLVWNVLSAPLLLVGLTEPMGIWACVRSSFSAARRRWRRLWLPVTAQGVMLGLVVVLVVTYVTESRSPGGAREIERGIWTQVLHDAGRSSVTVTTTRTASVNAVWVGGYQDDSKWDDKLAEVLKVPGIAVVDLLGILLLAFVSVLVKLHIARVLQTREEPTPASSDPPRGAVLLLLLVLVPGCGRSLTTPELEKEAETAFRTVKPGRFHVRSRRVSSFPTRDPEQQAVKDLLAPLALRKNGWQTEINEYVAGSDARFRIEAGDRTRDFAASLADASSGRSPEDARLLLLERDVVAGQRLLLLVAHRREPLGGKAELKVVLFGGTNTPFAWPRPSHAVEGGPPFGAGVGLEVAVEGDRAPGRGGTFFSMHVPHSTGRSWLAADLDRAFPIVSLLYVDPSKRRSTRARVGTRSSGDDVRVAYESETVTIVGDGVEYEMTVDGKVFEDIAQWESPVWIVRGRFIPRGGD